MPSVALYGKFQLPEDCRGALRFKQTCLSTWVAERAVSPMGKGGASQKNKKTGRVKRPPGTFKEGRTLAPPMKKQKLEGRPVCSPDYLKIQPANGRSVLISKWGALVFVHFSSPGKKTRRSAIAPIVKRTQAPTTSPALIRRTNP